MNPSPYPGPFNSAHVRARIVKILLIAALFAYLVVDAIDDKQEETAEKIKLGNFAEPPPPPVNLQMPDTLAPAP
jgi:hypothetical protein